MSLSPVVRLWLLVAGLLGYTALAVGSGADRLSAGDPELAARIPSLFASEALRTLGADALTHGNAGKAADIGARAIADSPTDPQSSALWAAGTLARGNQALAENGFRVAGQLGWRVPITQSYWMGKALVDGRYDLAAMRLDALLRQQPRLLRQRQLVDPMERNPAGQTALIARMRLNPVWRDYYASDVDGVPLDSLMQRAAVLDQVARTGLRVGCPVIAPMASQLAGRGQPRTAVTLWRQHCPAAGSGLVSDPQLSTMDVTAKPSAFDWELIANGDLALAIVPSGHGPGKRLVVDGMADVTRPVLAQRVVLDTGAYQLSWRSGNNEGQASDHLLAAITCPGEAPVWLKPTLDRAAGLWRVAVDVTGTCGAQRLVIAAAPRSGQVWLEQVTLTRLP